MSHKNKMAKKGFALGLPKGFTLIELMVVLSIIGVLMALTLTGIGSSRKAARDARRKADLETIRGGLEFYKSDCNKYPLGSEVVKSTPLEGTGPPAPASCAVANIYISSVPKDPLDPARRYPYSYTAATKKYTLCASLENTPSSFNNADCGSCGSGMTCNYKVTNP